MDNVSLNRQFLEADGNDEEKECTLLFNTYHKVVFETIDKMMRNHSDPAVDADDLTSETFIQAFKKRDEVREPEKLLGWLLSIARNLTLNEIRNAKRRRRIGDSFLESLENHSTSGREAHHASLLMETDVAQIEADRYLMEQLRCLLSDKDRVVVDSMHDGFSRKEIAETIHSTPGAVQKRWERIRKWLRPIGLHLDTLVDCLPAEDRKIMERYLDGQPLLEIAKAIGISGSAVEERVKRVIAQWKKAAEENPTDPVSAMVHNKRGLLPK